MGRKLTLRAPHRKRTAGATWDEWYAELATLPNPAIIGLDGLVTYAALTRRARAMVDWLDAEGVPRGRPVAAMLPMSVDAAALTLAGVATERPIAPLNVRTTPSELEIVLGRLDAGVLVAEQSVLDLAAAAGERCQLAVLEQVAVGESDADLLGATDRAWDHVGAILHTSGTTGVPKPVPYRLGPLAERVRVNSGLLGLRPGDRYATASPFHHAAGIGNLFVALGCGAAMCPLPRFSGGTWAQIQQVGATHATLVPAMIEMLLSSGPLDPGRLRCLQYGASSIGERTLRRLMEVVPGVDLVQLYGQTEGTPLTVLSAADHRRALDDGVPHLLTTAGCAIADVELVLHDLDKDGVGEVWARARHLMLPEPDGWVRTGDLATMNDEGYLTVLGRTGDMINRGGENVYPAEIEAVLARHPSIADVAVVGRPDQRLGQLIAAYVVPSAGVDRPTDGVLTSFARGELADFKVPEEWHWLDELPRTASGKVLRRVLAGG